MIKSLSIENEEKIANENLRQNLEFKKMPVNKEHLNALNGFKYIVKTTPNGSCLYNATSLHLYGNENKAENFYF